MKKIFPAFLVIVLFSCAEKKQPALPLQSLPVIQVASGNATIYQQFPASIQGAADVEIRPQVNGTLDKVFVEEGAFVKMGQPLFKINEAPYREKINTAKAILHAAEGAVANMQLEIDKFTPLVQAKVIAEYQLKNALLAKQIAMANVEQAKSEIAAAQINIGYTLISAPVSGYIGLLPKKIGSLVTTVDATALTSLTDVHEVHVYFALGEYDFIRFKEQYPGRTLAEKIKQLPPVELILADESAYALKGKIDLMDGQFNKNTGAITLRASFPNPDGLLRSGNTGKVKLGLGFTNQLVVPQSATIEVQEKIFVYVLNDSNKVTKQSITIMGKSGTDYLVKDGLKAGDRIVATGFDHLKEDEVISPEKFMGTVAKLVINK